MPSFEVYTHTSYDITYVIEADDAQDAYEKFMRGDDFLDVTYTNDVQEVLRIEPTDFQPDSLSS